VTCPSVVTQKVAKTQVKLGDVGPDSLVLLSLPALSELLLVCRLGLSQISHALVHTLVHALVHGLVHGLRSVSIADVRLLGGL